MATVESRSLQGALTGHRRIDALYKVGRTMAVVHLDGHSRHSAGVCAQFGRQSSCNQEGSMQDCLRRSGDQPHGGDQMTRSLADAVCSADQMKLPMRYHGYEWACTHVCGHITTRSSSYKRVTYCTYTLSYPCHHVHHDAERLCIMLTAAMKLVTDLASTTAIMLSK